MDSVGIADSINTVVSRASDTTTTTLVQSAFSLSDQLMMPIIITLATLPIMFFSYEIWRRWRIKNEEIK